MARAGKKGAVLPTPIFAKLQNAEQHYVQSSYEKFHQIRTRSGVNTDIIAFTVKCHCHWSEFLNKPHSFNILNMSFIKCYANREKDAENTGKFSFTPLNKNGWHCPNFRERHKSSAAVCYTEFHQNLSINATCTRTYCMTHVSAGPHSCLQSTSTPKFMAPRQTMQWLIRCRTPTDGRGLHIRHSQSLWEERLTPVHS